MPLTPEGEVVLSVGGPGGPVPGSAETGNFSPWAGANYPVFPASSPFYAFSAETGYGGGDTSLSSLSNAGYGGGYFDTGSGLSGGPSLQSFAPGMDAVPDSLIFDPNAAPTSPGFSYGPIASRGFTPVDYSPTSSGRDYPLAFMFLPSMKKQPTEFDTPYAYFQYLTQDQFWHTSSYPGGPDILNGRPASEWPEYLFPPGIIIPRDAMHGMFDPSEMAPVGPGRFPSLPPGSAAPVGPVPYLPRIPGFGPQVPFDPHSDEWWLEHHPGPKYFDQ